MLAAASSANMFLVCLRARAVFINDRPVAHAFSILWVIASACYAALPFAVSAVRIGPSRQCIDGEMKAYGCAGVVAAAAYDTLIFAAITYRLLGFHLVGDTWSARMRAFFTGAGMGQVSRALLQTGQLYYL